MSYQSSPNLPTDIYYVPSRRQVYTDVGHVKSMMTNWINSAANRRSWDNNKKQYVPAGKTDWSTKNPPRVYRLVRMDGLSVAEWDDVTEAIFENRMRHLGKGDEL